MRRWVPDDQPTTARHGVAVPWRVRGVWSQGQGLPTRPSWGREGHEWSVWVSQRSTVTQGGFSDQMVTVPHRVTEAKWGCSQLGGMRCPNQCRVRKSLAYEGQSWPGDHSLAVEVRPRVTVGQGRKGSRVPVSHSKGPPEGALEVRDHVGQGTRAPRGPQPCAPPCRPSVLRPVHLIAPAASCTLLPAAGLGAQRRPEPSLEGTRRLTPFPLTSAENGAVSSGLAAGRLVDLVRPSASSCLIEGAA